MNAKHARMRELGPKEFLPGSPPLPLAGDEIHLWFFPQWPHSTLAAAESLPLRRLLAGYLNCAAEQVRIERGEHGKPTLVAAPLEFNLSHSRGRLLVALCHGQPLGVDLEVSRRDRPVLELARRWFDPLEAAALTSLPEATRQAAFLRLWSCKESLLKALGRGIGFGLDRVVFDIDAAGDAQRLRRLDGEPAPSAWHVIGLRPFEGCVGALAWRGPARVIRAWVANSPAG